MRDLDKLLVEKHLFDFNENNKYRPFYCNKNNHVSVKFRIIETLDTIYVDEVCALRLKEFAYNKADEKEKNLSV